MTRRLDGDRRADRQPRIEKPCIGCSTPLKWHASDRPASYARRRFCGRSCALRFNHARDRVELHAARFWDKVDKSAGPTGCWFWTGARFQTGYGRVVRGGKTLVASRVSWDLANGPVPGRLFVCHHCDNPPCVNPAHLFLGDTQSNTADKMLKGRQSRGASHVASMAAIIRRGGDIHTAKLTEDKVREIRRRHSAGGVSFRAIGREFGLTHLTVAKCVRGQNWAHVK